MDTGIEDYTFCESIVKLGPERHYRTTRRVDDTTVLLNLAPDEFSLL